MSDNTLDRLCGSATIRIPQRVLRGRRRSARAGQTSRDPRLLLRGLDTRVLPQRVCLVDNFYHIAAPHGAVRPFCAILLAMHDISAHRFPAARRQNRARRLVGRPFDDYLSKTWTRPIVVHAPEATAAGDTL
ncbi:hypothetical protein [Thalassorhabdomicrobium marinisediminis]|uniref:hypothetical protein n=1 Tax=Thalassorhabdomicrobium marinisediminis TaxID=2170577 RepID=UPI002490BF2E|nr:hypothetical protein [Thalassorhabdomicrobium marinisediminis]